MSRFRRVDGGIWADERFLGLSDDGKFLWFYLLTGHEVTNLPGLLVAGRAQLSEALGWDVGRFDAAFELLATSFDDEGVPMATADWTKRVVWLPKGIKHNVPANPNVITGWRDAWRAVPECDLKGVAYTNLKASVEQLAEPFRLAFAKVVSEPPCHRRKTVYSNNIEVIETVSTTIPEPSAESSETVPRARVTAPDPAPVSVAASETRAVAPPADGTVFAMPDNFPLTDEARAAVEMLGVCDVEDEWVKFRGHHIAKGTVTTVRGFYALFTAKWAIDARRIQSRERSRDSGRVRSVEMRPVPVDDDPDYPDPKAISPEDLAERRRLAAELDAAIGAVH